MEELHTPKNIPALPGEMAPPSRDAVLKKQLAAEKAALKTAEANINPSTEKDVQSQVAG